jgi:hypothetical protein
LRHGSRSPALRSAASGRNIGDRAGLSRSAAWCRT